MEVLGSDHPLPMHLCVVNNVLPGLSWLWTHTEQAEESSKLLRTPVSSTKAIQSPKSCELSALGRHDRASPILAFNVTKTFGERPILIDRPNSLVCLGYLYSKRTYTYSAGIIGLHEFPELCGLRLSTYNLALFSPSFLKDFKHVCFHITVSFTAPIMQKDGMTSL
jgi:hypothetical protein